MSAFYEMTARFYDAELSDKVEDLRFYSEIAEEYGAPIFDVGCGTGRVLLHLAQENYPCHGIDNSRIMLDRLDNKLNALPHLKEFVSYAEGNVLELQSDQHYNLVLLTYNALMHFHEQADQIQLLERLHTITAPDGRLIIDLPNAGEVFATPDSDALIVDRRFIEPESGHMVMLQSTSYLDRTTQILRAQWIYDEITADGTVKRLFAPHVLRYFFLPEMQLLLQRTGFELSEVYGGYEGEPFEDGCERMLIIAQPR